GVFFVMDFFERIKKSFLSATKSEDESDTLAYMLRGSGLLMILYSIVLSAYCFITGKTAFAGTLVVLILAFIIMISYTYGGRLMVAMHVYHLTLLVIGLMGIYYFSPHSNYYFFISIGILALFFNTTSARQTKILYVLFDFFMTFVVLVLFNRRENVEDVSYFVLYFNMLMTTLLVIINGAAFSFKFAKTESKLYQYAQKLKKMADSDPLTGLMNRRNITGILEEIESGYESSNNLVSIAIGDIDFFKKVNDTYGHDCGDYVLKKISYIFEHYMIDKGYVARWGGEEFLFVFKNMNADHAYVCLEELRHSVEKYNFVYEGTGFKLTMTFGLDEMSSTMGTDETINNADKKLYMGKESGRNRVVY
nr:GGDEF domain-containing protein [Lachnospiraceae bacterium]